MPQDHFQVAVVLERRKLKGTWGGDQWLPRAVLPAEPATAPGTMLANDDEREICYGGGCEVTLYSAETAHYYDNLASGQPSLWVALEATATGDCRISSITADPYEGEALAGAMDLIVEPVPMPPEIVARIAAFVAAFHVDRAFIKRQRDDVHANTASPPRPRAAQGGERR